MKVLLFFITDIFALLGWYLTFNYPSDEPVLWMGGVCTGIATASVVLLISKFQNKKKSSW